MPDTRVSKILLHDRLVGHLTRFQDGKNLFVFDESYINPGPNRPVLSMSFTFPHDEEATESNLRGVYATRMKLPPFFSNLLPESVLRDYMVKRLKIHYDHEFDILMALGEGLPGAVRALPSDELPAQALDNRPEAGASGKTNPLIKFSLGGSQLKFSMVEHGGRFALDDGTEEWIVKPPHPTHPNVPINEYVMMRLAGSAGIEVPDIRLVSLNDLELAALSDLPIPQSEPWAYAIKRYDRSPAGRIHAEDFAQVFGVYADQEYKATNYDSMARLIFAVFPNRFEQLAELIRRIVVNILVGNGDAHLKNWSIIYRDGRTPQLSPLYDVLSSIQYISDDRAALNLGGEKRFDAMSELHFNRLAQRINAPPKFILDTVKETVAKAQQEWPKLMAGLPLPAEFRERLYIHWASLSPLLRITP